MEKPKVIIEPGRENDPLTIEGLKLRKELTEFCKADKTRGCLLLLCDKTGGADFCFEQEEGKSVASEFLEAAGKYPEIFEILKDILTKLQNL